MTHAFVSDKEEVPGSSPCRPTGESLYLRLFSPRRPVRWSQIVQWCMFTFRGMALSGRGTSREIVDAVGGGGIRMALVGGPGPRILLTLPPPVGAHQLPFGEDVFLHGVREPFCRRACADAETRSCVEGVDLEEVTVGAAWWTRSRVAAAAGSVHALLCPAG